MQLGFVIDHSRCIGCHACTVACKAENDVPVGAFRTWVKYTETGTFPSVKRSFAVLRCNQCTDAPCVEICPVHALDKRAADGVVDVDPARCIGCKACMQGCPYDALYINEGTGTAQKCHFCVHRTERGLAPACAVVCPTEAIIPGDFHDPESVVSRMRTEQGLTARKVEAGTGPNVFYREVDEAGIDPMQTNAAGGYLWAESVPGAQLDAEMFQALEEQAKARTVYDVDHRAWWGNKVTAYLFTKSVAAGGFLAGTLASLGLDAIPDPLRLAMAIVSLLFLAVTTVLLIADLKRPERFWYILRYPNWSSWLTRGTVVLVGYGAVASAWLILALGGIQVGGAGDTALLAVGSVFAALTAMYTAWLFGQSKGRVLWMKRGLALSLLAQAVIAGCAVLLPLAAALDLPSSSVANLRWGMIVALGVQGILALIESRLAPPKREAEYHRAAKLVSHGPFARLHWTLGIGAGVGVPLVLLAVAGGAVIPAIVASILALVGLFVEEDVLVRAGQAPSIS